jgi:hypothetical protein
MLLLPVVSYTLFEQLMFFAQLSVTENGSY